MAKLRILIADDEPIIRLDVKQMLGDAGYEVVGEAGDGAKALELARQLKPDVAILDVKMPVMDGIEAASVMCCENIAPALLLTAFSDHDLLERAKGAGVYAYLVKPFKAADLPPAIEVAIARFEQNVKLTSEIADLNERLETRKLLERAKGILMDTYKFGEGEAYRRIQQQSMNTRKSMREIAEAIVLAHTV